MSIKKQPKPRGGRQFDSKTGAKASRRSPWRGKPHCDTARARAMWRGDVDE
jgi:hypothetical protein